MRQFYAGANVNSTTGTFATLIERTNQVVYDMSTVVMTVADVTSANDSNGAQTTGNGHIQGYFSANVLIATQELRGGQNGEFGNSATLLIGSNTQIGDGSNPDTLVVYGTGTFNGSVVLGDTSADGVTFNAVVSSNIVPSSTDSKNLGQSGTEWSTLYVDDVAATGNVSLATNSDGTQGYISTGSSASLILHHDGSDAYIENSLGEFYIRGAGITLADDGTGETYLTADVDGAVSLYYNDVSKVSTSANGITVTGNTDITDGVYVSGISQFSNNVTVLGDLVVDGGSLSVTGGASLTLAQSNASISYITNLFVSLGDTDIGDTSTDTLTITAGIDSNVLPSANLTYSLGSTTKYWDNLYIDDVVVRTEVAAPVVDVATRVETPLINVEAEGEVRFYDTDNSNYAALKASANVVGNVTWTLPIADSNTAGYAMVSDAAGQLGWGPAGGAEISADTSTNQEFRVYFEETTSGVLLTARQDSGLTYNPSTGSLTAATFIGSLQGNATTATTATTATSATTFGGVTVGQLLRSDVYDEKTAGDLAFNDNVKMLFGTGSDLEIYHNANNSYIVDTGIGSLYIAGSAVEIRGGADAAELMAQFNDNGAVILYYDAAAKLQTTTTGVTVTGSITASSFSGSGASLTGLNGTNITTGTISDSVLPATITSDITGNVTGNLTGNVVGNITSTGSSSFSNIDVNGGTIDGTIIGDTVPAAGTFSSLSVSGGSLDGISIGTANAQPGYFTTLDATGGITGTLTGNASSATKWATARTLTLSGDASGATAAFDGTGNITLAVTVANDSHSHDTQYYTKAQSDANYLGAGGTANNSTYFNTLASSQFVRSDQDDTISQTLTFTDTAGGIVLNDNVELYFGTGTTADAYMRWTGSTLETKSNATWYIDMLGATDDIFIRDVSTLRFTFEVSGGNFTATGDVTAYSDERIKTNIEKISDPIEKVKQINGYTFDRTDIETDKRQSGVIAQEVIEVLPEVVRYDENEDRYTVAYGNMVGLLIEAIKEQQKQIDELKAKIGK